MQLSGEKLIILYDYHNWDHKNNNSNLFALNENLDDIWNAELPNEKDNYCNKIRINKNTLNAFTWESFDCTIDINTGKILDMRFIK